MQAPRARHALAHTLTRDVPTYNLAYMYNYIYISYTYIYMPIGTYAGIIDKKLCVPVCVGTYALLNMITICTCINATMCASWHYWVTY